MRTIKHIKEQIVEPNTNTLWLKEGILYEYVSGRWVKVGADFVSVTLREYEDAVAKNAIDPNKLYVITDYDTSTDERTTKISFEVTPTSLNLENIKDIVSSQFIGRYTPIAESINSGLINDSGASEFLREFPQYLISKEALLDNLAAIQVQVDASDYGEFNFSESGEPVQNNWIEVSAYSQESPAIGEPVLSDEEITNQCDLIRQYYTTGTELINIFESKLKEWQHSLASTLNYTFYIENSSQVQPLWVAILSAASELDAEGENYFVGEGKKIAVPFSNKIITQASNIRKTVPAIDGQPLTETAILDFGEISGGLLAINLPDIVKPGVEYSFIFKISPNAVVMPSLQLPASVIIPDFEMEADTLYEGTIKDNRLYIYSWSLSEDSGGGGGELDPVPEIIDDIDDLIS